MRQLRPERSENGRVAATASWRAGFVVLLLAGCSAAPAHRVPDAGAYLHDEAFPGSVAVRVETPMEIFALDADARRWMDSNINSIRDMNRRRNVLVNAVFDRTALDITYESAANTTASETFRRKSANCLSLTILMFAMAEYAGFETKFQEVDTNAYWERRGGYNLNSGHVNLRISNPVLRASTLTLSKLELEVDFQRPPGSRPPTRVVPRSRILAMFYNNSAIDALLKRNDDKAYAYLRAALLRDPELDMAITNLGLLYGRHGHLNLAETNFREAIRINPDNDVAVENLAAILKMTGRRDEAGDMLAGLERRLYRNPYYSYVKGEAAYDAGDLQRALVLFKRSVALGPEIGRFHAGLAKTYFRLGDRNRAEAALRRAERHAASENDRSRYRSKLEALSEL